MLPATPATSPLSDSSESSSTSSYSKGDGGGGLNGCSGAYNEPFVNMAECTSLHEGRQQISTILPVNIDTLFHTMYARSKFLDDFHASRKVFDIEHTDWRLEEETNKRRRTFKCKMPIKASIGPKFSCVTEIQTLRECSVPGSLYSVDITSYNENVPYADVFTVYVHHCLVRTVDDHTMFTVYLYVKFRKSVFSMIKSLIEKTTYSGCVEFHNDLALQLSRHFCTPRVRHKRHNRNSSRSKIIAAEVLSIETGGVDATQLSASQKYSNASSDRQSPKAANKPPKMATGIATYSAHELFVQQNLTANPEAARLKHGQRTTSPACMLMLLMVAVSLINVGLFLHLSGLNETSAGVGQTFDALLVRDMRPQDVANLSSDQWIRMFYGYHLQQQNKIAEMRRVLVTTIDSLKQMEENMLAVISVIVPPPSEPEKSRESTSIMEQTTVFEEA